MRCMGFPKIFINVIKNILSEAESAIDAVWRASHQTPKEGPTRGSNQPTSLFHSIVPVPKENGSARYEVQNERITNIFFADDCSVYL
ncbi:Hypothetical protein FKW44_011155, partial [Caligus rogercresseyi]